MKISIDYNLDSRAQKFDYNLILFTHWVLDYYLIPGGAKVLQYFEILFLSIRVLR